MTRDLKIYWLFCINSLKITLQHRFGILFFLFGKILRFLMFFFLIMGLLRNTRILAGYTLVQTMIFYLTFNLIDTLGQLLFREVYRFRPLVLSGELDGVLTKPYHPFLKILFGGLDLLDLVMLFPYLGLLIYFFYQFTNITSSGIIIYILLLLNSLIITTGFYIIVLALGVLTTEVDHTIMIYRDLSRMAVVPIDIYKEPLKSIITYIIPIGIMMAFPVKALFGMLSWQTVLVSFLFGVLIISTGLFSWKTALKKYQSCGS